MEMSHSYSLVFDDEEVEEIHKQYEAGATFKELAEKYYCNKNTIRKVLLKYDPKCIRRRGPRDVLLRERIVESMPNVRAIRIYKRYVDGDSPASIARDYHVSRSAIWNVIHAVERVARKRGILDGEPHRQRRKALV